MVEKSRFQAAFFETARAGTTRGNSQGLFLRAVSRYLINGRKKPLSGGFFRDCAGGVLYILGYIPAFAGMYHIFVITNIAVELEHGLSFSLKTRYCFNALIML